MTVTAAADAAERLAERGRARLRSAEQLLRQIEQTEPPFTRQNILDPLNALALELTNAGTEAGLLSEVHPHVAVREAAEQLERDVQQLRTTLLLSRPLYDALVGIDPDTLDPLARRALELSRRDMRRAGVALDEAGRARVRALQDEMTRLDQEFARTIRDDVRAVDLARDDLEGLPDDYVRAHLLADGQRARISTDYPDYLPFMAYARSEPARRQLLQAFQERAVPANLDVLDRLLACRHELATLLGYSHWADYITEDKMSGSAERVRSFVAEAFDATRESAAAELQDLLAVRGAEGRKGDRIGEWELSYLLEQVKAQRFDFDSRAARPYFEYRAVKEAVIALNAELFGLTFRRVDEPEAWHPSVETFEVEVDGEPMGRISLDMHPREGKFKHAACFTWRVGVGGMQKPHGVLVCNFPDPEAQAEPALMEHREVVTYFHEFGHLVHNIVRGRVPWVRLSGVAEWDFVEAPSQFLEEWIFDAEVLRRFARHVETGSTIPTDLVERLRAARDFGRGLHVQRQLFFTAVSLALHDRDPSSLDTTALVHDLAHEYAPFDLLPESRFHASFGHLTGYSAMYYTYMWSLVIAKDLLSAFEDRGLMDLPQARRYRDLVLAPGGSKPAAALVEDFLGRPYNFEAFRRWLAVEAEPNGNP